MFNRKLLKERKGLPVYSAALSMARYTDGIVPTDEMPNGLDIVDWLMGVR